MPGFAAVGCAQDDSGRTYCTSVVPVNKLDAQDVISCFLILPAPRRAAIGGV